MDIEGIINSLPDLTQPFATPDNSDYLKASSVLLILHKIDQQWQLLFTKRADHLSSHAGQISFPGGRFESVDQNLMETALRETEEEIGVSRNHLRVFSQMDEHPTQTGYRIFPYVAFSHNLPELVIDKAEVDEVFSAPLLYLLDGKNQQLATAIYNEKKYSYYKIIWRDKIIWGATARMIVNLSSYFNDDAPLPQPLKHGH